MFHGYTQNMENNKTVLDYYEANSEDQRLYTIHQIEFIRTKEIIARYLPDRPIRIIDLCGAVGHYAYWLAEMGHEVHLLDLSPRHIEKAQENRKKYNADLKNIETGDARSIKYKDETFDMVLLMGALYHLQAREDRIQCLSEAHRILKNGGIAVFAYISRFAPLMESFQNGRIQDPQKQIAVEQELYDGKHTNPEKNPVDFTTAYFHSTDEIYTELLQTKFKDIVLYAVEGFARLIDKEAYLHDEKKLKTLLYNIGLIEQNMELMGMSDHKLAVCKKQGSRAG